MLRVHRHQRRRVRLLDDPAQVCRAGVSGDVDLVVPPAAEERQLSLNEAVLRREAAIVTMWIFSDNWQGEKEPLEGMHDCFFSYAGVAEETHPDNPSTLRDLNDRYNFYFAAKDGTAASFLTSLLANLMRASDSNFVDPSFCGLMKEHLLRVTSGMKGLL